MTDPMTDPETNLVSGPLSTVVLPAWTSGSANQQARATDIRDQMMRDAAVAYAAHQVPLDGVADAAVAKKAAEDHQVVAALPAACQSVVNRLTTPDLWIGASRGTCLDGVVTAVSIATKVSSGAIRLRAKDAIDRLEAGPCENLACGKPGAVNDRVWRGGSGNMLRYKVCDTCFALLPATLRTAMKAAGQPT